jgi:hypothetical protein
MATKTKNKKAKVVKPTLAQQTANAAPTANAAGGPVDQGGLSIGDLKNISTVLDVASTRGAFKAAEMATVGLIYNKLQAFLAKVAPPEPKKEEGAPRPTPAPTTVNTGGK